MSGKEGLYQTVGETERTIRELSKIYADLPDSNHFGAGGTMKPTEKQVLIKKQIDKANENAERLLKLIEKDKD